MTAPEHLWRFPTRDAIASLANRFGLANAPDMQDWEWEVADPERIEEFLGAYLNGDLSDDERFTLMEVLLQSFEDSEADLASDPRWGQVLSALDQHIDLHAFSVWGWSCVDKPVNADWWRVTPWLRRILARHRARLERGGDASFDAPRP